MTVPPIAPRTAPPDIDRELTFTSDLETVRNEWRWHAETESGERVVLAQLRPELAADEALRRRYVYEAERIAQIRSTALSKTLAVGSNQPSSIAPWRLRRDPLGKRLDHWLAQYAPAAIDEVLELIAQLADAVGSLHSEGFVLRDLEPRTIVWKEDGSICITDVGLARIDILSSRTASSLMLESSAYAAPEHLRATIVDARADLYTLAAIAWQGLTGVLPHDDGSPFLRKFSELPSLESLRAGVPDGVDTLLRACLSEDPNDRPNSAEEFKDMLMGNASMGTLTVVRVRCQACNSELRAGLRLCLTCGKTAIQFKKAEDDPGYSLILKKASDDEEFHQGLRQFFQDVGESVPENLNFLTGDARMYSKAERESRVKLPVPLLSGLSKSAADDLSIRLKDIDIEVVTKVTKDSVAERKKANRFLVGSAVVTTGLIGTAIATGVWPIALLGVIVGATLGGIGLYGRSTAKKSVVPSLAELRATPLALPASDPLVAKVATFLADDIQADVREQVSKLALLVQRLCDHRGQLANASGELELVLSPLSTLVDLVGDEVTSLCTIDKELASLDEGTLIRAIAASEARNEESTRRMVFLDGLDRLRALEDRRAEHMGSLLQAGALLERTIHLGLAFGDDTALQSNRITMALAALNDVE